MHEINITQRKNVNCQGNKIFKILHTLLQTTHKTNKWEWRHWTLNCQCKSMSFSCCACWLIFLLRRGNGSRSSQRINVNEWRELCECFQCVRMEKRFWNKPSYIATRRAVQKVAGRPLYYRQHSSYVWNSWSRRSFYNWPNCCMYAACRMWMVNHTHNHSRCVAVTKTQPLVGYFTFWLMTTHRVVWMCRYSFWCSTMSTVGTYWIRCGYTTALHQMWVRIGWKKGGQSWMKTKTERFVTNIWWESFGTGKVLFWLAICIV